MSDASVAALDAFVEVLADGPAPARGADADGPAFYSGICAAICRLTTADRAVLFRYDSARRQVRAAGAHAIDLAVFDDAFVTVETLGAARDALAADRVIELRDAPALPAEFAALAGDAHLVVTPMAAGGRWIGVVICARALGRPPLDDAERELLWTLGKTAALAATARVATFQAQRARELESRIDLARSIHDGAVQRLFGVSLALAGDGALDAADRARCADEVQATLRQLRAAVQRPLGRASRASSSTLAAELARLRAAHADLGVELDADGVAAVPAELEPLAQSVLVEAVRNAHKHARPTRVRVRTSDRDGAFVLTIRNDGVQGRARVTGMGLRLAALEALHQGGILEFGEREPGEWQVRLVVTGRG